MHPNDATQPPWNIRGTLGPYQLARCSLNACTSPPFLPSPVPQQYQDDSKAAALAQAVERLGEKVEEKEQEKTVVKAELQRKVRAVRVRACSGWWSVCAARVLAAWLRGVAGAVGALGRAMVPQTAAGRLSGWSSGAGVREWGREGEMAGSQRQRMPVGASCAGQSVMGLARHML